MLKVEVSGTYYTVSNGNHNEIGFEFTKVIPEIPENWLLSILRNRFVPMWLEEEHKNKPNKFPKFNYKHNPYMSCYVSDTEIVNKSDDIAGKNVFEMEAKELQVAAAKYLLTEVPLPSTVPLKELKNLVALNYFKVIKGIKADSNEDKEKLDFYKKNQNGEWILDFGDFDLILEEIDHKEKDENKPVKKITAREIMEQSSPGEEETNNSHELSEEELARLDG